MTNTILLIAISYLMSILAYWGSAFYVWVVLLKKENEAGVDTKNSYFFRKAATSFLGVLVWFPLLMYATVELQELTSEDVFVWAIIVWAIVAGSVFAVIKRWFS